jgi:hypothetical protein
VVVQPRTAKEMSQLAAEETARQAAAKPASEGETRHGKE